MTVPQRWGLAGALAALVLLLGYAAGVEHVRGRQWRVERDQALQGATDSLAALQLARRVVAALTAEAAREHARGDSLARQSAVDSMRTADALRQLAQVRPLPRPVLTNPLGQPATRVDSLQATVNAQGAVITALQTELAGWQARSQSQMRELASLSRAVAAQDSALTTAEHTIAGLRTTLEHSRADDCRWALGLLACPSRTTAALLGVAVGVAGHLAVERLAATR